MKKHMQKIKNNKLLFLSGVVLILIAFITSFGFWLYNNPITPAKSQIMTNLNLPVAKVGTKYIGGRELFKKIEQSTKIYGSEEDKITNDQILNRLIELSKLTQIADIHNISVSEEELEAEFLRLEEQEGGTDQFSKILSDNFYMDKSYFKNVIITPELKYTKLAIWFYENEELNPQLYETLTTVQKRLKEGQDFGDLAKLYSEDTSTKQFSGDSGEVRINNLAPELIDPIKSAEIGEIIVVPTRFGVYILKLINKNLDEKNNGTAHFQSIMLNYGKPNSKAENSAFSTWYSVQESGILSKKYLKLIN